MVPIVLINTYAPNVDDLDFFKTLTMHIDTLKLEIIIMGCDFNIAGTFSLDCLNRYSNNQKVRNYFVDWAENKCLVDVLRFGILTLENMHGIEEPQIQKSIYVWDITSFLWLTQASCWNNGYKWDHAIIQMKLVNGPFDIVLLIIKAMLRFWKIRIVYKM